MYSNYKKTLFYINICYLQMNTSNHRQLTKSCNSEKKRDRREKYTSGKRGGDWLLLLLDL